ncbi:MAG: phytase, partial [Acidobacteria bacterium]|nr:phytase [Acidobacteriota bacterium]
MSTRFASSLLATLFVAACSQSRPPADIRPVVITQPVSDDADDPAIWVNPADPARSLIVGTNKVPAPRGALVVWGLDGKIRQTVAGIDQPNNVDVEYGIFLRSGPVDIAVVTERLQRRLRVYRITAEGLTDISSGSGVRVFEGQSGAQVEPMGIALYRRPGDLAVFAIVSRKSGPRNGYLWEYELRDD